jgi:hypothetical protein
MDTELLKNDGKVKQGRGEYEMKTEIQTVKVDGPAKKRSTHALKDQQWRRGHFWLPVGVRSALILSESSRGQWGDDSPPNISWPVRHSSCLSSHKARKSMLAALVTRMAFKIHNFSDFTAAMREMTNLTPLTIECKLIIMRDFSLVSNILGCPFVSPFPSSFLPYFSAHKRADNDLLCRSFDPQDEKRTGITATSSF